jgi:hypothetical protein
MTEIFIDTAYRYGMFIPVMLSASEASAFREKKKQILRLRLRMTFKVLNAVDATLSNAPRRCL